MAKSSITKPAQGASEAAMAFADGHVDPVRPVAETLTAEALAASADPMEPLRQAAQVSLSQDLLDKAMSESASDGFILIVCGTPGFRRAGMTHPSRAEYPLDGFTAEQLALLRSEPRLQLVEVGGTAVPRNERMFGVRSLLLTQPYDPLLAGQAAADAISRPPNRSEPGMRNAVGGFSAR